MQLSRRRLSWRVFEKDEMRLDRIDEGKRVIDLKVSDNDSANAWLANVALSPCPGRADASQRPSVCTLSFNVGRIPDFDASHARN